MLLEEGDHPAARPLDAGDAGGGEGCVSRQWHMTHGRVAGRLGQGQLGANVEQEELGLREAILGEKSVEAERHAIPPPPDDDDGGEARL